jgi:hypothetical protein
MCCVQPASPLDHVMPYSAAVEGLEGSGDSAGGTLPELPGPPAAAAGAGTPAAEAQGASRPQAPLPEGLLGPLVAQQGEVAFGAGLAPTPETCPQTAMEALG